MPHHIQLADNANLARQRGLSTQQLGVLNNRYVEGDRNGSAGKRRWQAEFLNFTFEKPLPMGEMLEQRLVIHIARGLLSTDDTTDPANQLDRRVLRTCHPRPQHRLIKDLWDGLSKHWGFNMKNGLSIPRTESNCPNIGRAL